MACCSFLIIWLHLLDSASALGFLLLFMVHDYKVEITPIYLISFLSFKILISTLYINCSLPVLVLHQLDTRQSRLRGGNYN